MQTKSKKREKSVMRSSKISFKESVMGACTNLMYKFHTMGGVSQLPKVFKKEEPLKQNIVILGEKMSNQQLAYQKFKHIIWFTYKQKLKLTQSLKSDVGWGCLPRVGQMLLAQAIIKHYQFQGRKITQSVLIQLIGHFIDHQSQQNSQYSLSTMLKYARWKFGIDPGQWFNIGQISDVLRKIQDQRPVQNSQNLKIAFFSQSVIFKSNIVSTCGYEPCKCELKHPLFCPFCHKTSPKDRKLQKQFQIPLSTFKQGFQSISQVLLDQQKRESVQSSQKQQSLHSYYSDEIQIDKKDCLGQKNQLKNHLLLLISVRTGQKSISSRDYQSMKYLLSSKMSIGAMGGVPSKAIYIVGYQKQQVIYLDPHFVQQFISKEQISQNLQSFFCKNYRLLGRKSLDPSMAFGFYLSTMEQVQQLLQSIQKMKKKCEQENETTFISIMDSDNFAEQLNMYRNSSPFENSMENKPSYEYNSLEFRNIEDDSY